MFSLFYYNGYLAVPTRRKRQQSSSVLFILSKLMKQFYLKSLLLSIFAMLSSSAMAYDCKVDGICYNLNTDTYEAEVTSDIYKYSGNVIIPSSINYNGVQYSVTGISGYAFYGCTRLTSVTIPSSVTSIGSSAFYGCIHLEKVVVEDLAAWCGISFGDSSSNPLCHAYHLYDKNDNEIIDLVIPNGVTSIGDYAFERCTGLTSINIPNSVTSIGSSAFDGCTGLTSVNIPNSVTSIGSSAFYKCTGLTSITIPNSVTSIAYQAFYGCTRLKKVVVEDLAAWCGIYFGVSSNPLYYAHHLYDKNDNEITDLVIPNSVTSIGEYAFNGCTGLTSVTIPNSVTSIGSEAFYSCTGLTSVNIPNSVTSIEYYAFSKCTGLTSISIPNSVTSIGSSAFDGCTGLTSITIPNSVTSIGSSAFYECTGLTSVSIPNSVTSIGRYAFERCTGLKKVVVEDLAAWCGISFDSSYSNPLYYAHHLYDKNDNEITDLVIPNSVTSIGYAAFYGCTGLTSVNIPNSVTSIGYYAFSGCTGLTSVNIPNSVTSIGSSVFYECTGLTSVSIPNSVTSIGGSAFSYCTGLTSINIPNSVTSIGSYAFDGCTGLTSINIPNSVTSIGNSAFRDCTGLTNINIPNSVTSIGESAFYGCIGLTSINIPNSVTSIGSYAFYECTGLTSVNIPNSVTSIEEYAFRGCTGLTSVNIPNSVTSIGDYAFYGCTGLTSITIPSNVTEIGSSAFDETATLYVQQGSPSLLAIWQRGLKNHIVEIGSNREIASKWYTATSSSIRVFDFQPMDGYVKTAESIVFNNDTIGNIIKGLKPEYSSKLTWKLTLQDAQGKLTNYTFTESGVRTQRLELTTQQPKVISAGNIIVSATSNLDDEEENVGFEWRRTDWTDDFSSNTGGAYLFEGTMEGYIRNLYTEKLWKYRPYYETSGGIRYYGEWVGIDPTNTSYFEPTVHTYATYSVEGNAVNVKGYAMRGTDNVTEQGFKYWITTDDTRHAAPSTQTVPDDAKTVKASGNVMTAQLTELEYDSDYCFVAYVKTSEGEIFYGEIQSVRTGSGTLGIGSVTMNGTDATEVARYNLKGHRINSPQPGLNIIRMSDGTVRKVFVK